MKALPQEPRFEDILMTREPQVIKALQELQTTHDLRRVVLEGLEFFKEVEAGTVKVTAADLSRYQTAAKHYQALLVKNEWHDKELDDLIRNEVH